MIAVAYEFAGKTEIMHPAPQMFDPGSPTRLMLKSRGVDFANDAAVMEWIKAKDIPPGAENVREIECDSITDARRKA